MKLTKVFKRNNEDNLMKRKITKILLLTRLFSKKNKVTKEQREVNRGKRNELQLIVDRSRAIGFNYICNREKPAKICFGSSLPRKPLPKETKYMSPLMKRVIKAPGKCPGPTTYYYDRSFIKQYPNRNGYTLIASKVPRMKITDVTSTPPVGSYDIESVKPIKKSKSPFGVNARPKESQCQVTPGPGSYNFFKKTIRVQDSFGGKRHHIPTVQVICTPVNYSICKFCSKVPFGDYWRNFQTKEDMCRSCMGLQMAELKTCAAFKSLGKSKKLAELKIFERARYCDFYHRHNGTRAALPVMDKKILKKKLNKENYLAMFNM